MPLPVSRQDGGFFNEYYNTNKGTERQLDPLFIRVGAQIRTHVTFL